MNSQIPQPITTFLGYVNGVTSASFSPCGALLATGGYDGVIRLWDVNAWRETRTLLGNYRGHVAFAPDGRHLLSGGMSKITKVFDTSSWEVVAGLDDTGNVWALAFRPDGTQVLIIQPNADLDGTSVDLWDAHSWTMMGSVDIGGGDVYAVSYSSDNRFVAIGHYPGGSVSVWTADVTQKLVSFPAHDGAIFTLAFSPDSITLATGGADNVARLWDTVSWTLRHQFTEDKSNRNVTFSNGVLGIAYSPDGSLLVTGRLDGTITVWRL